MVPVIQAEMKAPFPAGEASKGRLCRQACVLHGSSVALAPVGVSCQIPPSVCGPLSSALQDQRCRLAFLRCVVSQYLVIAAVFVRKLF